MYSFSILDKRLKKISGSWDASETIWFEDFQPKTRIQTKQFKG